MDEADPPSPKRRTSYRLFRRFCERAPDKLLLRIATNPQVLKERRAVAAEVLIARYESVLLAVAVSILRDKVEGQDALQIACEKLFLRAPERVLASPAEFFPYAYRVVRNVAYDLLGGRWRTAPDPPEEYAVGAEGPAPEESVLQSLQREEIQRLFAHCGLSEEEQAILWAKAFGYASREIAQWFDIPPSKVDSLAFQARARLRRAFPDRRVDDG